MTLLTVVVVLGFIRLGFWQLHRADEKRDLLAAYAAGQQSLVDLASADVARLPRYQKVEASGQFDSAQQILLDNMPSQNGSAGFRVLTPLKESDGHIVLIDRGWVPMGATRHDVPAIAVSDRERTITGQLDHPPVPGVRIGGPLDIPAVWPKLLNFPEQADLNSIYGSSLVSGIVLLDPKADDGFERVWQAHFGFGPERHIAYAVQWFALAAAVAVTFIVVNLKPRQKKS
jgi:surfeit locus 1 family protein